MQELMVHVHQVLVHERVVARDLAIQHPNLEAAVAVVGQLRHRSDLSKFLVAWEDEHEPVRLTACVATYSIGQRPVPVQVRNAHARTGAVVGPTVIPTLQPLVLHDAHAQWHLTVGTPVLEGVRLARLRSHQHDLGPRERHGEGLARLEITGPGDGVPEAWVEARGAGRRDVPRRDDVTVLAQWRLCLRDRHIAQRTGRCHAG